MHANAAKTAKNNIQTTLRLFWRVAPPSNRRESYQAEIHEFFSSSHRRSVNYMNGASSLKSEPRQPTQRWQQHENYSKAASGRRLSLLLPSLLLSTDDGTG